jgi:hypothetical protein
MTAEIEPLTSAIYVPGRWLRILIATGVIMTLGGYESRVIDQCYRLPILEKRLDPSSFPMDPFVDSFTDFNPHQVYVELLSMGAKTVGLSLTLFLLHIVTVAFCISAIWRIRKSLWPELPEWSDWLLVSMFALLKAGNLGTNHLWEDHLLDRQIGFTLGWLALAEFLDAGTRKTWAIPILIGAMAMIHPGLGVLSATLWLGTFLIGFGIGMVRLNTFAQFSVSIIAAMIPWAVIYLPQARVMKLGVEKAEFWALATELQGPQHMRPIYWRESQWLSAGILVVMALMSVKLYRSKCNLESLKKIAIWSSLILFGLLLAVPLIEIFHVLDVALAQPFRLATPLRGLCLIVLLPHLIGLIHQQSLIGMARAFGLLFSMRSDWGFVVASAVELSMIATDFSIASVVSKTVRIRFQWLSFLGTGFYGISWLIKHDPAESESLLMGGYLTGLAISFLATKIQSGTGWNLKDQTFQRRPSREFRLAIYSWALPVIALICGLSDPAGAFRLTQIISSKWRVAEVPLSDSEKVGVWARRNIPEDAMVLIPPRDKSFRYWSRRSVVCNVAGSPYQAKSLKEWALRLKKLAGKSDLSLMEFARQWPEKRVEFEMGFERLSAADWSALADEFQADTLMVPVTEQGKRLEKMGWRQVHAAGKWSLWQRAVDHARTSSKR